MMTKWSELPGPSSLVRRANSVCDNLFWYNDGIFHIIPYKISGRNLDFYPPPEFMQLLDELGVDF
ncbi:MAG: hypothetical protein ACFFCT_14715 [Candidatus Odinarchaeota archaeon]